MFYVIDTADRMLSFDTQKNESERFTTYKAAEKRAKELADSSPGVAFQIVAPVAQVICNVGEPQVKRL